MGEGYITQFGYMGLVGEDWILFSTDTEYYEFLDDSL